MVKPTALIIDDTRSPRLQLGGFCVGVSGVATGDTVELPLRGPVLVVAGALPADSGQPAQ